jgi:hypothetical protein
MKAKTRSSEQNYSLKADEKLFHYETHISYTWRAYYNPLRKGCHQLAICHENISKPEKILREELNDAR